MHSVQGEIGKPTIQEEKVTETLSVFRFFPLPPGFGHTLGNSFRRVLLSSIPGVAVTKVKIKGAAHEYTSLEGLDDSILDLLLNLKQVVFEMDGSDPQSVTLSKKGEGQILASDIDLPGNVSVLTPDFVIANLTEKTANLDIELVIEKGIGFRSSKEVLQKEGDNGWILLDAIFSPVSSVQYSVLPARVGDMTNLDTLEISVETTGSLVPADAIKFSAQILEGYFQFFQNESEQKVEEDFLADFSVSQPGVDVPVDDEQETYTPIEILNLSPRTLNALINGNIGSVEEVLSSSPAQLEAMRGFGKKAMTELVEALEGNGYDHSLV